MDSFGWSTQPPAVPTCPNDDALLAAFLGASSFEEFQSTADETLSSDAYGALGLPPCQGDLSLLRCQNGATLPGHADTSSSAFLDSVSVGLLPALAGAHDGFAFPNVHEEPAQAAGASNAAFSGYSTTTGGGNISSGESNTYGGGGGGLDTEVASPPCAVSRRVQIAQVAPPPTKRNKLPDKYQAPAGATTTRSATSITFGQNGGGRRGYEPDTEAIAQVKEMIYRAAAMRPVSGTAIGEAPHASTETPSSSKPRRRKNVRISSDPQTVAARRRRERVSERLRALQRLVPGGSKMDTASMLDEAASYLRFLKSQVAALESLGGGGRGDDDGRYSSPLQRYAGRNFDLSSRGVGGHGAGSSTVLAFGRYGGVAGYVRSNRNMQL